eukprot:TRINITY_DN10256_c0_g1_i1.p1 TRINITY_DN10256_c0_g1~~TRINITY_DN10256_c0_g1_i1.p1  ORF type:complete len:164 (+),score=13.25 TRINITY_DN10256_c0_g1_i1:125-616(+)
MANISTEPENHVIAVDEGENTEKAFMWACASYPAPHKFIIVHGRFDHQSFTRHRPAFNLHETDEDKENTEHKHQQIFDRYRYLCKKMNRNCEFQSLDYHSPSVLGTKICEVAHAHNSTSVVCSSRELGTIGKVLLGSTSASILSDCDIPVSYTHLTLPTTPYV